MTSNRNGLLSAAIVFAAGAAMYLLPDRTTDSSHYGFWSLGPAVVTILVCFMTRNVLLALLLGIASGGLISSNVNIIDAYLIPSLGSEKYAQILLVYLWALGALLGLWNRNGGARYFASYAANKFVRSRTSAKVFAWFLGIVFHQGGTISTVLTGTTVRPISDQHKVSHEELSYVVDSTASPIATLIPFNVWPVYIAGLITVGSMSTVISDEAAAVTLYLQAIPFNFYAIVAITMTLLLALDRLPTIGPMKHAIHRVKTNGQLDRSGAKPLASAELTQSDVDPDYQSSNLDFLAPIGTLFGFCIVPWVLGSSPMVFEGFGSAVVVSIVVSLLKGMSVNDAFDAVVSGIKGVTVGAIILGLAVTLATVSEDLGTSEYVVMATSGMLKAAPFVLPTLLLAICMVVAFSIGSSWGTYAVVFPIALPLALSLSTDPLFMTLCFGAVMGGAVFGDQCSPISDTTILSSLACGADVMDHVLSQLPLALIAAGISSIGYLILSATMVEFAH